MIRQRLAPLFNTTQPSVRRRVVALALLGVGLPVLFLAGIGLLQTSGVARFLRETTIEYGHYAGILVGNALQEEVDRRAFDAAERARLAASWAGASPDFLPLLASDDPLFTEPFITPIEVVRARLDSIGVFASPIPDDLPAGGTAELRACPPASRRAAPRSQEGPGGAFGVLPDGAEPVSRPRAEAAPGPADGRIVPVPVARSRSDSLDGAIALPAGVWRRLLTARGDTMIVVVGSARGDSATAGQGTYLVFPLLGFPSARSPSPAGASIPPA